MMLLQAGPSYNPELTKDAIELSKTIQDLGALTVMSGIFIILVLVMFSYFIYQLISQQRQIKVIAEFSEKALEYFKDQSRRIITPDQAEILLTTSVKLARQNTILQVIKIIRENNINNRDRVMCKIQNYVDLTYSQLQNRLSKFEIGNRNLAQLLESSWKQDIVKQMDCDTQTKEWDIYKLDEIYTSIFNRHESILLSKINLDNENN